MSECYGEITKVPYSHGRYMYNAVVWMPNGHILCAIYDKFKTEDEAREWLKSLPTVGEIYMKEVK
jgi:hypothetical protein